MQFALSRALLACAFLASFAYAAVKQQPLQQQQQQKPLQPNAAPPKLKRDAGLSFGSGIYHGPSHKYLPPAASGGYESTYATLHGNGLASSSGFDFASVDSDNSQHQYHHYSHQQPHTYQSLSSHHGHGRPVYISSAGGGSAGGYHHRPQGPKVETYIVQTSGGHGHGHQGHGAGHGNGNGLGGGYKYSGHGSGFYSLLGGGGSGGGSHIGHKQHGAISSTYLLSTPGYSSSSSSSGGGGSSSIHGLGHGHGHHSSIGSIGSLGSIGSSHGLGHSLNLGAHHFAPALSHGVEHEEHTGYNYEAPSVHYKQPLSSYGVPLLPGYEHGQHGVEQELHHEEQQLPLAQHASEHKSPAEQQPPAYALGHKGLGHFSYTSSKPLALNTDIHHLGAGAHEDHNELVAELSKVPFKPSAFLGAKHEPSAGYDFATPSTQYLQGPTSGGYDYPAPAVLYGAPGQSGDSATPIFEPESTYLPPVSSYGAPATPTHGYA